MTSSSPTTTDLGGTVVRLRQRTAEPNRAGTVLMMVVIAYTFAAGGVYWLKTGSTTLGVGGVLTPLGQALAFGPFFAWVPIYLLVGDRGPFRALYLPRSTIDLEVRLDPFEARDPRHPGNGCVRRSASSWPRPALG
jgi:hypothetical protein